jgi:hypothetical protein
VHIAAHKHFAVTVSRRYGIVVAPISHQRQRGDARHQLLARVVMRRKKLRKGCQIVLKPLADRLVVTTQAVPLGTCGSSREDGH